LKLEVDVITGRAININVRWGSACSSWKSIDRRLYIALAYMCLYIATQPVIAPLENSAKWGNVVVPWNCAVWSVVAIIDAIGRFKVD
jgi:hypothetical protein